jgi:hypothetical protein
MNTTEYLRAPTYARVVWVNLPVIPTLVVCLTCFLAPCRGQGSMTIGFEGTAFPGAPQPQPPGTISTISQYTESGMRFRTPAGPQTLALVGGGISANPENGTAYLQLHAPLEFQFVSPAAFDLLSLDLAEYSTNLTGPVTAHVVGYGLQGQVVGTTDLTTDGVNDGTGPLADFQMFTLDSRFRNLFRVQITSEFWSIDNVVIGGVPEPSAGGLLLLAAACAFGRSWVKRRRP